MSNSYERNRDDEDFDERRGVRNGVKGENLAVFVERLRRGGVDHTSYYHYTKWESFRKMMQPVEDGPARGKRLLLLTVASKTNDGIEKEWGDNVFMACFSYSLYEDVAMWMNYGRKSPDAIRIRFAGCEVANWYERHKNGDGFYKAVKEGNGFKYEALDRSEIESVKLVDVAYVIPSWMTRGRLTGNVEYSRNFYRVLKDGSMAWSDSVYNGEQPPDLLPYFKKRGWCYERETRLVVKLKSTSPGIERLAVSFCAPFNELARQMKEGECDRALLRSPWYKKETASQDDILGVRLADIHPSDYVEEIKIFSDCDNCKFKALGAGSEKVKILAFGDLHKCGLDCVDPSECDIAIITGDMLSKGSYPAVQPPKSHIDKQIAWVNETLIPWCKRYKNTQFVIVAGNCDEFALTSENPLRHLPKDTNIHYLQDSMVEIKGVKIWGTPWTKPKHKRLGHPNEYRMFEKSAEFLSAAYSKMPSGIDVLVSHSTPAVPDSWIAGDPANKFGNETLTSCIEEMVPTVCVCVHSHARDHKPAWRGKTVVFNVSLIEDRNCQKPRFLPRTFTLSRSSSGKWECERVRENELNAEDYKFKFYHGEEKCPEGIYPGAWGAEKNLYENPMFRKRHFEEYEATSIASLPQALRDAKVDDVTRASAFCFACASDSNDPDLAMEMYLRGPEWAKGKV